MVTSYLFSDLDMAFFTLMNESALPEVVPDPISRFRPAKVEQLRLEFLERQQLGGNLSLNGEDVSLNLNLAKVLAPIFMGDYALYHEDQALTRIADYDVGFYISEKLGVTLLRREDRKRYRITWYPDIDQCHPDFLAGFSLGGLGPYKEPPFKICGEAGEMDQLINRGKKDKLADCAKRHGMTEERLAKILKRLANSADAVIIVVGRSESIKLGGIKAKLLPKQQEMFRFIASPDGHLEVFESFTNENLMRQIMNFEGR